MLLIILWSLRHKLFGAHCTKKNFWRKILKLLITWCALYLIILYCYWLVVVVIVKVLCHSIIGVHVAQRGLWIDSLNLLIMRLHELHLRNRRLSLNRSIGRVIKEVSSLTSLKLRMRIVDRWCCHLVKLIHSLPILIWLVTHHRASIQQCRLKVECLVPLLSWDTWCIWRFVKILWILENTLRNDFMFVIVFLRRRANILRFILKDRWWYATHYLFNF